MKENFDQKILKLTTMVAYAVMELFNKKLNFILFVFSDKYIHKASNFGDKCDKSALRHVSNLSASCDKFADIGNERVQSEISKHMKDIIINNPDLIVDFISDKINDDVNGDVNSDVIFYEDDWENLETEIKKYLKSLERFV